MYAKRSLIFWFHKSFISNFMDLEIFRQIFFFFVQNALKHIFKNPDLMEYSKKKKGNNCYFTILNIKPEEAYSLKMEICIFYACFRYMQIEVFISMISL